MYTTPFHSTKPVTVSPKWQVVLPREVRDKMKVQPQDKVMVTAVSERKAVIEIVDDPVESAMGMLGRYDSRGDGFSRMLSEKRAEIHKDE